MRAHRPELLLFRRTLQATEHGSVVLPQCRGGKYGKALMDWAMAVFSGSGVRKIEVKVVDGNDAVHLYEKYGFRMNAHILVRGE